MAVLVLANRTKICCNIESLSYFKEIAVVQHIILRLKGRIARAPVGIVVCN